RLVTRIFVLLEVAAGVGILAGVLAGQSYSQAPQVPTMPEPVAALTLTQEQASAFAKLALKGIQREYPNHPGHVVNDAADVKSPRALHPAFFGCFDWHSSVHGHWMLVRLLKRFPGLPEEKQIRGVLAAHLTAENIRVE